MLSSKAGLAILFSTVLVLAPAFASSTDHKFSTSPRKSSAAAHTSAASTHGAHRAKAKSHKLHGQQAIESARVTEIQQALIREHYMSGEADGSWDATTQAAMQKYQADHGWQTRLIPDSRALKKLGLGPDYSGAINSEGASFTPPASSSTIPQSQSSGFAAASGANQ
ncbi:MAG TPA: peptidoglycan-binding domain-containing protein [Terracidiphilus sp.]